MEFLTFNCGQTQRAGRILAKKVLKLPLKNRALILGLEGDLGGGKTSFLQGFAGGLGIKEKITSPTFVIMKKFKIPKTKSRWLCHIDCYRIQKPKEILGLGLKEVFSNPENIVAVEWADKVKKILPENTAWLKFEFIDKNKRRIKIGSKSFLC